MVKKFAAVFWVDEGAYSAILVKKLEVLLDENSDISCMVGGRYDAEYEKGKKSKCEVMALGTRKQMERIVLDKASEAAENSLLEKDEEYHAQEKQSRKERAKRETEMPLELTKDSKRGRLEQKEINRDRNSERVLSELGSNAPQSLNAPIFSAQEVAAAGGLELDAIEDLDESLSGQMNTEDAENGTVNNDDGVVNLKRRLRKALRRIKQLEGKAKMLHNPSSNIVREKLDIGNGIQVDKAIVDDIIADYSCNPSKFLRQLMIRTEVFTLEEIAKCSVKGKGSGQNRLPPLNVHKFSTVKNFTIKTLRLRANTVEMLQFEKSMVSLCTDARKMLKNKQ